MKLIELVHNVDRSTDNTHDVNVYDLLGELGIPFECGYKEQKRLVYHWAAKWYCTDTYVGHKVYYFDDRPVAYSFQVARKASENFYWLSKETMEEVRKYVLEIVQLENLPIVELIDRDMEMGGGIEIAFSSQILYNTCIYKPLRETVDIVKTYHGYDTETWKKAVIFIPSLGVKRLVEVSELLFPYKTQKK